MTLYYFIQGYRVFTQEAQRVTVLTLLFYTRVQSLYTRGTEGNSLDTYYFIQGYRVFTQEAQRVTVLTHYFIQGYRGFISVQCCFSDLFDDEGFSLSDINEMVVSAKLSSRNEVYLMDSDEEQDRIDELTNEYSHDSLSMNEEIDLQKAKVCVYSEASFPRQKYEAIIIMFMPFM